MHSAAADWPRPQMVDRAVERHMDNLMSKLEQRLRCMLPEPAAVVASDASAAAAAATPQLKTMSPSRVPPALANHPMPAPLWDEPSTPVSGVRLESGLMAEMTLSHQVCFQAPLPLPLARGTNASPRHTARRMGGYVLGDLQGALSLGGEMGSDFQSDR
jgi:hypothetical protein